MPPEPSNVVAWAPRRPPNPRDRAHRWIFGLWALALAGRQRLAQLLPRGAQVELLSADRDRDRYGRLLRQVRVDGRDVGDVLVDEGLARPWRGHRQPWC